MEREMHANFPNNIQISIIKFISMEIYNFIPILKIICKCLSEIQGIVLTYGPSFKKFKLRDKTNT